jgi:hypothetical protein
MKNLRIYELTDLRMDRLPSSIERRLPPWLSSVAVPARLSFRVAVEIPVRPAATIRQGSFQFVNP